MARNSADWSPLLARAEVVFFAQAFDDEDDAAAKLADFEIVLSMRERTPLPASLINRLPKLRMLGITGARNASLDTEPAPRGACSCATRWRRRTAATAELALGLLLAAARAIPAADANIRGGTISGRRTGRHQPGGKDHRDHRAWPSRVGWPAMPGAEHDRAGVERKPDGREGAGGGRHPGFERRAFVAV